MRRSRASLGISSSSNGAEPPANREISSTSPWSLTPETAGVVREDQKGPGYGPIGAWIRRSSGAFTLMTLPRGFDAWLRMVSARAHAEPRPTSGRWRRIWAGFGTRAQ